MIMKSGIMLLLLFLALAVNSLPYQPHNELSRSIPNYPGLQFNSSGKLSITVFSDLHFGETEVRGRGNSDLKTLFVMAGVLDREKPHFVVYNGDMISCENVQNNAVLDGLLAQVVAPTATRSIPFAAVFGNHDASQTCSTRYLSDQMRNVRGWNGKKLSFTTNSVDGSENDVGTGNYFVPVYSSEDESRLAMLLWFFDSRGGHVYGKEPKEPKEDYVHPQVVSWYEHTRDEFEKQHGKTIPSAVFVHIPVQATRAFQKALPKDQFREDYPGLWVDKIGHQDDCGRDECYGGGDKPFMSALVETKGLMAVFSGHDHATDWCMKWDKNLDTKPENGKGMFICFSRHGGYGGYSDFKRGARQILFEENRLEKKEVETWNRLEDGTISGRVTLNSTYGTTDRYPVVKYDKTF